MVRFNVIACVIVLSFASPKAFADWSVDVESGVAYNGYNDVRIPGNTGTDLSLTEDLDAERAEFIRVRLTRHLGERHQLSLLVAPLRFKASGTAARTVDFNGAQFAAGVPLHSYYRFDSYRLTYRYTLIRHERVTAGIGFTGKIRDAAIRLDDGIMSSEKANTGFVPLVNFALDWRPASRFGFLLEGDALAAPQGRAEDVLSAFYVNPVDQVRLRLGYRILEGGADNDEVYTFALVHYLSAGVTLTF